MNEDNMTFEQLHGHPGGAAHDARTVVAPPEHEAAAGAAMGGVLPHGAPPVVAPVIAPLPGLAGHSSTTHTVVGATPRTEAYRSGNTAQSMYGAFDHSVADALDDAGMLFDK